jgi:imidazoleglycerol-phosphate dehydratase
MTTLERATKETKIKTTLNLTGGNTEIASGIGFFDHMLAALAFHAGWGLALHVDGDLAVDGHHTVEDTGIVLGQALHKALGDKSGITRFGSAYIPMDEALGFAAVDVSGRPFLTYDVPAMQGQLGGYDACLTEEFFRALATHAGITLHLRLLYGSNAHHMTEALFKAAAHALKQALTPAPGIQSTKGVL